MKLSKHAREAVQKQLRFIASEIKGIETDELLSINDVPFSEAQEIITQKARRELYRFNNDFIAWTHSAARLLYIVQSYEDILKKFCLNAAGDAFPLPESWKKNPKNTLFRLFIHELPGIQSYYMGGE